MKKAFIAILIIVILLIGMVGIKFGSALFQEENTTEVLTAIMKLEFSNNQYQQVTEQDTSVMYVSKHQSGNQEHIVTDFLAEKGWSFIEQMGSGYIFEKGNDTIVIETRLFTKKYFLWGVPDRASQ